MKDRKIRLCIKTITFADGHEVYEICREHSVRLPWRTLTWHTWFGETTIKDDPICFGPWREILGGNHHFSYATLYEAKTQMDHYAKGVVTWRGHRFVPMHGYGDLYYCSTVGAKRDGIHLHYGIYGSLEDCMNQTVKYARAEAAEKMDGVKYGEPVAVKDGEHI